MSRSFRKTRPLLAAFTILGSAAAMAWTPYGAGPSGPNLHSPWGPPDAHAPTTVPEAQDLNRVPGSTPDYTFPGASPYQYGYGPRPRTYPQFGPGHGFRGKGPGYGFRGTSRPLQISRAATPDAYVIDIQLNGMKPEDIQITARGSWISVSRKQSRQETREDEFEQGGSYSRSYSFSSTSASRRFNVPRDGDLTAMTREISEDVLRVLIPRHSR